MLAKSTWNLLYVLVTIYTRGLKLTAREPHAAREGIICGPQHITWNSEKLG